MEIAEEDYPYLESIYTNIFHNLLQNDLKSKPTSLLITLLDMKSNRRYRLLKSAAISATDIPVDILNKFLRNGLVRESDERDKYTITGKGIWIVEKNKNKLTVDKLIEDLDSKFLNLYKEINSLNDKEKVIIFSMIAARTFSEDAPIDLKKDEYALDAWRRIINECYKKLNCWGIIREISEEKLYGKKGNEHPVSNLIRHTDALPKKTKGIYTAAGNQKYYLDLFLKDKNELSKDALIFLIGLIFCSKDEKKTPKILDPREVYRFCRDLAYKEGKYIYDFNKLHFVTLKYDEVIEDAIGNSLIGF